MRTVRGLIHFILILICAGSEAQVNTERFRKDADSLGFSMLSDFDLTLMAGNTDFQLIGTNTRLNVNWGTAYTFLILSGGFGRNEGKSFFNETLSHLRHVHTLNPIIQMELFAQYDINKKRFLDSRKLIGAGLRYKIFKSGSYKFRLGSSYYYETERYEFPDINTHSAKISAHRLSFYMTHEVIIKKDMGLTSVTYFQPAIGFRKDLRILSDNALLINLGKGISINLKCTYRYDSRPPDTIKVYDLITRMGISMEFG